MTRTQALNLVKNYAEFKPLIEAYGKGSVIEFKLRRRWIECTYPKFDSPPKYYRAVSPIY